MISSDTLTLAESLQEQLDVARPAVAELEALRDELFRSLEASDAQLGEVRRAEQEAVALGNSLKVQLAELMTRTETVEGALAAAVEAKAAAVKLAADQEAALALASEEKAAAEVEAVKSASILVAVTKEKDLAMSALAEKHAALEAALKATTAAAAAEPSVRGAAVRALPDATAPAPSPPAAAVESIIKEKEALEARVQRRNASVETLQHDLAKLNTSHAVSRNEQMSVL